MAALSARCCEYNRRQGMCKETRRSAGVPPATKWGRLCTCPESARVAGWSASALVLAAFFCGYVFLEVLGGCLSNSSNFSRSASERSDLLSYHKRYMVISLFYTLLTPLFLPLFQKTLCQHNCSLDQKIGQCPATMTPFPIAIMTFTMALRLPAPMLRTTTTPPAVANNKKIIRYHGSFALVMLGQFMETCEKTQGKYKCLTQNKIAYYCFTLSPGRPTRSITHRHGTL